MLAAIGAEVHTPMQEDIRTAAATAGLDAKVFNPDAAPPEARFKALVFDATGIASTEQLHEAWAFFHPTIRRVRTAGRVIILGTPPEDAGNAARGGRPARARGAQPLDRQGGPQGRRGAAGLRRSRGGERDRIDAAVPALAQIGLRVRPGDPDRTV